jgi:hypothetical protein
MGVSQFQPTQLQELVRRSTAPIRQTSVQFVETVARGWLMSWCGFL